MVSILQASGVQGETRNARSTRTHKPMVLELQMYTVIDLNKQRNTKSIPKFETLTGFDVVDRIGADVVEVEICGVVSSKRNEIHRYASL